MSRHDGGGNSLQFYKSSGGLFWNIGTSSVKSKKGERSGTIDDPDKRE